MRGRFMDNDLISRSALKEAYLREFWITMEKYGAVDALGVMEKVIDNAPTVDVERPKGEWIDISPTEWECNKCGYEVNRWNNTKFCPNCGAKMVNHEAKKIDPIIEAIRENNSKFEERPNIDFEGVHYDI